MPLMFPILPIASTPTPLGVVIILFFVVLCIGSGAISAWVAFRHLEDEGRELDDIRKLEGKVNEEWLTTILKNAELNEKNLGRRLTLRRLQLIKEILYGNEGANQTKAIQPPHMNDLHNLTEQAIMSSQSATILRIATSVLLIIGICGTLWGVHAVLGQTADLAEIPMDKFAQSLLPSAIAVLFTIILLTVRGVYLMAADRFLYKLDRETMVRWLPALIPSAGLDTEIAEFAKAIHKFNEDIETNMAPLSTALTNVCATSEKMDSAISDLKSSNSSLQTALINTITPACEALTSRQESIEQSIKATEATLTQVNGSLGMLQNLNKKLTEEASLYTESLNATRELINLNRDKLEAATANSDKLSKAVAKMNQDVSELGNVAEIATNLNETITNTSAQMDAKSAFLKETADNTVDWLNYAKDNMTAIEQHTGNISTAAAEIKSASETATAAAGSVQQQAENFSGKLAGYDQKIVEERGQMVRAREELEKKSQAVSKVLDDIVSRARALERKIITPASFLDRIGLGKSSESVSPRRKRR